MTDALLRRLSRLEGIDLTAVVISWRGRRRLAAEVPPGVPVLAAAFPARLAHGLWQRFDRPRIGGFDLVHGPNFVVPPAGGGSELVTVHDFGPWHHPELVTAHSRAYPRLVERAVARGAHVHVVSEFVAGEARELLGVAEARLHVIPNGFDADAIGDAAGARALVEGPYVLSVGTIEPRKDLPTLVAAMAEVWEEIPDLRLVVAGADGWGSDAFRAAIDRVGAGERVVRLGYVTDRQRADLLAGATCLAFPSIYEGFGLPPLEAMANGTPVVTTTAGALPETCGEAARYVAPGDEAALAAAIVAVATDGGLARSLTEAGRDRLRRYSWDETARAMAELYHRIVGSQPSGRRR